MQHHPYSIRLLAEGDVGGPLVVADVESAADPPQAVIPANGVPGDAVAPQRLVVDGHVVQITPELTDETNRESACRRQVGRDAEAIENVVVVVPDDREVDVALRRSTDAPPRADAMAPAEICEESAELFLSGLLEC